uniref:Polyadenylation factor subunit 2 n=1 Tax=Lygus hesperus TaxID=30085 RepID=A0A0A9ZIR4_LYGHE
MFVQFNPGSMLQLGPDCSLLLDAPTSAPTSTISPAPPATDAAAPATAPASAPPPSLQQHQERELFQIWIKGVDDDTDAPVIRTCPIVPHTTELQPSTFNLEQLAQQIGRSDRQTQLLVRISTLRMHLSQESQQTQQRRQRTRLLEDKLHTLMRQLFNSFKDRASSANLLTIQSSFAQLFPTASSHSNPSMAGVTDHTTDTDGSEDSDTYVYGAFSKTEGGNRRRLYHDSDDDDDILRDTTNVCNRQRRQISACGSSTSSPLHQASVTLSSLRQNQPCTVESVETALQVLRQLHTTAAANSTDPDTVATLDRYCRQVTNIRQQ